MSPSRRSPESTRHLRAALVEHARRIVIRDGAAALTMRAVAAEAGCALGLPYKVFADRHELIAEVLNIEFARLRTAMDEFVERAGTGTVAHNLAWFADLVLASPAVPLGKQVLTDPSMAEAVSARAQETGVRHVEFESVFADYLAAEKRAGRLDPTVDEQAFAFFIAGAIHNLAIAGEMYPQPSGSELERFLSEMARRLGPVSQSHNNKKRNS